MAQPGMNARSQTRMLVFAVVIILIAVASILEPPGSLQAVGYAVVVVVILAFMVRERRRRQ